MNSLYQFATGPLVWFSFSVFLFGSAVRVVRFILLSRKKDRPVYTNFQTGWAAASIARWLLPLNITATASPFVTAAGFIFHISALAVALFLSAHVILVEEAWGVGWWTLPDGVADTLTLLFLGAALFFALRRAVVPHVKILTTTGDWIVLLLATLPFLTGFLAYRQIGDYNTMVLLHVLSGNLFLIAVPFSKLSHMYMFFISRTVTGSDFGKRQVGAW